MVKPGHIYAVKTRTGKLRNNKIVNQQASNYATY